MNKNILISTLMQYIIACDSESYSDLISVLPAAVINKAELLEKITDPAYNFSDFTKEMITEETKPYLNSNPNFINWVSTQL